MRFNRSLTLFLLTLISSIPLLGEGQTTSGPITSIDQLDNQTSIQIGDQLTFRILEDEDPATLLTVSDSGQVQVPYVGSVMAMNRTPRDLAYQIKRALESNLYKKATVMISVERRTVRSPGRIYLTGEIARPGPLELRANESLTLAQAILESGGFSDFANKRKVKLVRASAPKTEIKVIDVAAIVTQGRADLDVALKPGDVIVVPARFFNW
jgi:protein involved in polysaccharide export with SLBB domain